jgi:flagellar biosynthetic protein FlhB
MAENKEGQEKTEPASAKRLNEARMRGQVSKSMDVTTAAVLLFGGLTIYTLGGSLIGNLENFIKFCLNQSSTFQLNYNNTIEFYTQIISFLGTFLLPILGIIFLISLGSEISQVGLRIATKKFTEGLLFRMVFNPLAGLKRIFFSSRSLFELAKSIVKVFILGLVVYWVLYDETENAISLIEKPINEIASYLVSLSFEVLFKVGGVYIIIAITDYFYQKYKYKKDLMMTKQEVKEESKQAEGDPKIKSRLRQIMRQRLRRIMLKKVRTAEVVITNPTHFAVALKYKIGEMNAPVVVAKGVDYLAVQIIEIATQSGVIIVEQPPLARTLFYSVEVDKEIPENLFKAVAQVLAYVYQLKRKIKEKRSYWN